jgi:hypothetical protein
MTAPVRHRPVIERGADATGRRTYRLACTCGTGGEEHAARRLAEWDLDKHVAALPPVPAARQCRAPKRHGCRFWEPCALCEHQTVLFDLEAAS